MGFDSPGGGYEFRIVTDDPGRKNQRNPEEVLFRIQKRLEWLREEVALVRIRFGEQRRKIEVVVPMVLHMKRGADLEHPRLEGRARPDFRQNRRHEIADLPQPEGAEGGHAAGEDSAVPVDADKGPFPGKTGQYAVPDQGDEGGLHQGERDAELFRQLPCAGKLVSSPDIAGFYFFQQVFPHLQKLVRHEALLPEFIINYSENIDLVNS